MEIRKILELESGERDKFVGLIEKYKNNRAKPEELVAMVNRLLTEAFDAGRKHGK